MWDVQSAGRLYVGELYTHSQSNEVFTVVTVGTKLPTGEPQVVFEGDDGRHWIMPLQKWSEIVQLPDGRRRPRFVWGSCV